MSSLYHSETRLTALQQSKIDSDESEAQSTHRANTNNRAHVADRTSGELSLIMPAVSCSAPPFVTPTGSLQGRDALMMEFAAALFPRTSCISHENYLYFSLSTYEYLSKHGNSAAERLWLQAPGWPS